jgi:hypothetical protein
MWKLYKLQLILMSPLLVVSLIIILPIYYICKFLNLVLFKKQRIDLVLQQT